MDEPETMALASNTRDPNQDTMTAPVNTSLTFHAPGSTHAAMGGSLSTSMIQGAADFTIAGGNFASGANVTVHHHYPHSDLGLASISATLPTLINDASSESEIYSNQLLRQKRGFPLYVPGPRQTLPEEYRESGVAIGDVGRITPEGSFDFFFNIYLAADHPINNRNVPESFFPLPLYESLDVYDQSYLAGNHVSTPSVQRLDPDIFPGGDFIFSCRAPQGAVLALPHGSHLRKLDNLEAVRTYAAAHAESWFKYINGPRGRGLDGSLYLVTGCEKAPSWGVASFHTVDNSFQLSFKPVDGATQYRWRGNPAQKKYHDASTIHETLWNQTTFIHGLSISLGRGVWARLFETVQIREIGDMGYQLRSPGGNPMSSSQGSALLPWVLGFLGGAAAKGGNYAGHNGHVVLSDLPAISEIFHPGDMINNYILAKAPQATVVMSHDDDWRDILGDEDPGSQVRNLSEFLQRISDQYEIVEKDGATFLQAMSASPGKERPSTLQPPPITALHKRSICTHCDKVFATGSHLGRHQRIHIGEKNYACSFPGCTTRRSREDHLRAHYRVHLQVRTSEKLLRMALEKRRGKTPVHQPIASRSDYFRETRDNTQKNFHSPFQNFDHPTTDTREYHNNAATYNFQAATSPTPLTATGLSAMTTGVAAQPPPQQSSLSYHPSLAGRAVAGPSKAKRQRVPEPAASSNDQKDDDMDGEMEEEGGALTKPPGACARCRNLKVKCEFKTETDPCKRCFNGGHECVTPGRKKRRMPPKREHLLNQIREQAAEIRKLMTLLEVSNAGQHLPKPPNPAAIDSLPLTPSSGGNGGLHSPVLSPSYTTPSLSYFNNSDPNNLSIKAESENNQAVEDWIAKARDSLAEFDAFIGIGSGGMPKSLPAKEDFEASSNKEDEDGNAEDPEDSSDEPNSNEKVEIEVPDSEGEEVTHRGRRGGKLRQLSIASSSTNGRVAPRKKDPGGEKLATLPSEASLFGLMADLNLNEGRTGSPDDQMDDGSAPALGVANSSFFRSSPTPDPIRSRPLSVDTTVMPHILTRGLVTPQEAAKLFDIYFQRMNLSVSLLDPVLYTPQKTCYRSPFLFTVVCAIASRFYTERPELYSQAMYFAQLAAGTALISGHKCVELCQGYILMSLYPAPAKRWEEERGWLYLGLAIRMATDLNMHLPNTAQPINEAHAREMLNRTRVWLNCFNLDRSTGPQYGKAPTISNGDYTANHTWEWWRSSPYNMQNFDIHICAHTSELKVMATFMATIYSDPEHPTGLNKNIDFEAIASRTDEELQLLQEKWQQILEQTDMTDPQNKFRSGLLKLAYSYARLVALSFGFQHAFGKNNTDENPFLNRCVVAASDVVKAIVEDIGGPDQRIYLRHGPITQSVCVIFAASMLVKLLQPNFASYLTTDKRQEFRGLVKQVIDLLASPDISIDDKHGPNLYARFLKGLLATPLAKGNSKQRRPVRSTSGQLAMDGDRDSTPSSHTSPETNYSLSPPSSYASPQTNLSSLPTTAGLSFDRFAPPLNADIDPFMPFAVGDRNMLGLDADLSPLDFFPPSLPYNHQDPLQGMQALATGWPDGGWGWPP